MSNQVSSVSSSQNRGLEECKSTFEGRRSHPLINPKIQQIVEKYRTRQENSFDRDAKRIQMSDPRTSLTGPFTAEPFPSESFAIRPIATRQSSTEPFTPSPFTPRSIVTRPPAMKLSRSWTPGLLCTGRPPSRLFISGESPTEQSSARSSTPRPFILEQTSSQNLTVKKTSNATQARHTLEFSCEGKEYLLYPTSCFDGVCTMHALLGSVNEQGLYYLADARSVYAKKMTSSRETYFAASKYLTSLLKDYLWEEDCDAYNYLLFRSFPQKIEELKERLASTADQEEREKLYKDFFTFSVLDAYESLCLQEEYLFSDCELEYAAELFNKRVTLFRVVVGKEIEKRTFGPEEGQPAWIIYDRGHYSFCEPKVDP